MIGALILGGLKCEEGGISEKCNHKHTLEACAPTYFTLVMICKLYLCVFFLFFPLVLLTICFCFDFIMTWMSNYTSSNDSNFDYGTH